MEKTFSIGVVLGAALGSSFTKNMKLTNASFDKLGTTIKKLNYTKLDIKQYKKLASQGDTGSDKMKKLAKNLKAAGINVNRLDRETRELNVSMFKLKQLSKVKIKLDSKKQEFDTVKGSILGITGALYGMKKLLDARGNTLKAQGEIASLGISEEGIAKISAAGAKFSNKYAQVSKAAFISASYDIKSGIESLSDEGVAEYTRLASMTAVATKSSSAEMTKLIALGHGIFKSSDEGDIDFGKRFSSSIAGAVKTFRTDGADLTGGITNIGASAKTMGVTLVEELSVLGVAKKAFNSASDAGTGYRSFLDNVGRAQEKLGIELTDTNGKMLPMVEVLKRVKSEVGDLSVVENSDLLKDAFGSDEAVKLIKALVDKTDELSSAQGALVKSTEGGTQSLEAMAKAMQRGRGFERLGNVMTNLADTLGKSLYPAAELLAGGIGYVAVGIQKLDALVPGLVPAVSGLTLGFVGLVLVSKAAKYAKLGLSIATLELRSSFIAQMVTHPKIVLGLRSIGRTSLFARIHTLRLSIAQKASAASGWLMAAGSKAAALWTGRAALVQKGAAVASGVFALATKGVGLAFRFALGPIGWVITAVAAVGTAVVWAYNKFDWFKGAVDTVWSWVKTAFSFSPLGLIMDGWGKAFDWLSEKFDWFKGAADMFKDVASGIAGFFGFGNVESKLEVGNTVKNVAVGTAMATQIATAQPAQEMIAPVASQKVQKSQSSPVGNTYNITVQVQSGDPQSIAKEVERVVRNMEDSRRNRSFDDEDV